MLFAVVPTALLLLMAACNNLPSGIIPLASHANELSPCCLADHVDVAKMPLPDQLLL